MTSNFRQHLFSGGFSPNHVVPRTCLSPALQPSTPHVQLTSSGTPADPLLAQIKLLASPGYMVRQSLCLWMVTLASWNVAVGALWPQPAMLHTVPPEAFIFWKEMVLT